MRQIIRAEVWEMRESTLEFRGSEFICRYCIAYILSKVRYYSMCNNYGWRGQIEAWARVSATSFRVVVFAVHIGI